MVFINQQGIVGKISEQYGLIWSVYDGKGFQALCSVFARLPFDWIKSIVESPSFIVPSDMER